MTSANHPTFVFLDNAMSNFSEMIFANVSSSSTWTENSSFPAAVDPDDYEPYYLRPETYIIPIVFALIFIVGVLGNGTLVLIFIRHKNMRNVPNTYILSLALGDLLLIVTCVPFTSMLYTLESWPFGELICKLSECVKDVSTGVSVFTLTALSAERYCAIVNPIRRHMMLSTKPLTILTALGIWVLALIFALPAAIFSDTQTTPPGQHNRSIEFCDPFPDELGANYAKLMVMFKFLVYYAIPLCIIAVFYVLMAIHLELSTRNMPGEMQGQSTQIVARKKVAKMVLLFVAIFIVCFLPYHVFSLWFRYHPDALDNYDDFWHILRMVGFCFSFINSCVNPIALYCVSGAFRKHFNNYLFCCCVEPQLAKRRGTMPSTATMYETSSHTMVHFNSTFRRNPHQLQLDNFNTATTNTTVLNHDKT